jgi:ribose transport system ATP-binding protein
MRGIHKRFGATRALQGVDLSVHAGEICALIGENGAGKSTLMQILSGAIHADAGEMRLDGQRFDPRDPAEARYRGVVMVYQELSLAGHLSVAENILLGMEPGRYGFVWRREMHSRARRALSELGHPDIPLDAPVNRLSTAEQQLVEIARALVLGCGVLVLDEPTSSLSQVDVEHLFAVMRSLQRRGLAIVYISHVIDEVYAIADRIAVIRDGRISGEGAASSTAIDDLVVMMTGQSVGELYRCSPRSKGEIVLELEDLGSSHWSLRLRRGEVVGIAGLVGAGRTALLRAIFGLDTVRTGTVQVGFFSGRLTPARAWQVGLGMLSEDRAREGLALDLSVAENMTLSGLPLIVNPDSQRTKACDWTRRLGIRCRDVDQTVRELSGGNQQKVGFARLLCHEADIWLLDEPTRGIDVGSKADIYGLIDAVASGGRPGRDQAGAVLMISSHVPELLGVCDRVAVMREGVLGEFRPVEELNVASLTHAVIAGGGR